MIDRKQIAGGLIGALTTRGHELVVASRGRCASEALEYSDLVLVGFGSPDHGAAEDLCRRIREHSSIPIIVVACADVQVDKAALLNAGSDDCIGGGQELRESVARVEAVLRRVGRSPVGDCRRSPAVSRDGLRVDPQTRTVRVKGDSVPVTRKEFDLLYYLASQPGTVLSRSQLMREVWRVKTREDLGPDFGRTVDTHVSLLRGKLGDRRWIETVRGVGFRFLSTTDCTGPATTPGEK